ncbi:MAG: hypothetical protein ACYCX4_10950 [Bacillota bacterium]
MYTDIKEILRAATNVLEYSWQNVFNLYHSQEEAKWIRIHGEIAAKKHFSHAEKYFSQKTWYRGQIKIKNLHPVTMCIGIQWIQRLACPSHLGSKCPNCSGKEPTLKKIVKNIQFNMDTKVIPKILSIQKGFNDGNLDNVFVIIVDGKPPYLYDGNSRLIAIATLPKTEEYEITCYMGVNN